MFTVAIWMLVWHRPMHDDMDLKMTKDLVQCQVAADAMNADAKKLHRNMTYSCEVRSKVVAGK